MFQPTELEGAVLGICWAEGPCTAYAIRKTLLRSPSPHWSGSAGSIYPLIERLKSHQLLRSRPKLAGKRPSKMLALTQTGLKNLRAWLELPHDPRVTGVPMDPLRTRMRFIGALSRNQRVRFIESARRDVDANIAVVKADCVAMRRSADLFAYLTARGALLALVARADWLDEVAAHYRDISSAQAAERTWSQPLSKRHRSLLRCERDIH